jgi:hypothetical protein
MNHYHIAARHRYTSAAVSCACRGRATSYTLLRTAMMTTTPQRSTDFTGEEGTYQSHQRKGAVIHLMQYAEVSHG